VHLAGRWQKRHIWRRARKRHQVMSSCHKAILFVYELQRSGWKTELRELLRNLLAQGAIDSLSSPCKYDIA
jgi:hypothetical protein